MRRSISCIIYNRSESADMIHLLSWSVGIGICRTEWVLCPSHRSWAANAEDETVGKFFSSDLRNLCMSDVINVLPFPPRTSKKNSHLEGAVWEGSSSNLIVVTPRMILWTTSLNTFLRSSLKRETDCKILCRSTSEKHWVSRVSNGVRFVGLLGSHILCIVMRLIDVRYSSVLLRTHYVGNHSLSETIWVQYLCRISFINMLWQAEKISIAFVG